MRKLTIAFWIFIGCMLLWQFYSYNQGLTKAAVEHPQQQHFYFLPPGTPKNTAATPAPVHEGPYVVQTAFTVQPNTPAPGSFTCAVTLKNDGTAKATNVQVEVRPFRRVRLDDDDMGRDVETYLPDTDYRAQISSWISFPPLAPGESNTQTTTFLMRNDMNPGLNPDPQIIFEPDKAGPQGTSPQPAPSPAANPNAPQHSPAGD